MKFLEFDEITEFLFHLGKLQCCCKILPMIFPEFELFELSIVMLLSEHDKAVESELLFMTPDAT